MYGCADFFLIFQACVEKKVCLHFFTEGSACLFQQILNNLYNHHGICTFTFLTKPLWIYDASKFVFSEGLLISVKSWQLQVHCYNCSPPPPPPLWNYSGSKPRVSIHASCLNIYLTMSTICIGLGLFWGYTVTCLTKFTPHPNFVGQLRVDQGNCRATFSQNEGKRLKPFSQLF